MRREHRGRVGEQRRVSFGTRLPPCSQLTISRCGGRRGGANGRASPSASQSSSYTLMSLARVGIRPTALEMRVASVP